MQAEFVLRLRRRPHFYEATAWNHFILYMHISLGVVFDIYENGGLYAPPEKLLRILCNSI